MSKIKAYITSFRLRTLPLAISSVLMGNFMAGYHKHYNHYVGVLAVITTVLLQILSNVANDYGDAVSGADNNERIGPARMVSSGKISHKEMKITMIVMAILSLLSGIVLIDNGNFERLGVQSWVLFALGLGAIAAAIKYTVGKNPYGYNGLGDIFVFIFFGLAGVIGTYFLHTGEVTPWLLLPASSVGLLSTGVLNLNNMRDVANDTQTGKKTLVVKKGIHWGKKYHITILILAMVLMIVYGYFNNTEPWQWLYILAFPVLISHLQFVIRNTKNELLDPHLKKLALTTFFMVLLFGIALVF